jgi:ribose/xylose/arabinose/galactoside ABC-type transport system permease subunit
MEKTLLAIVLALIGGVIVGYLTSLMGLPGWVRTIGVVCVIGGLLLLLQSREERKP